jgi:hypothetical protein
VNREEQHRGFRSSDEVEKFRRIELYGFVHRLVTASLYCSYLAAGSVVYSGKCNPETPACTTLCDVGRSYGV